MLSMKEALGALRAPGEALVPPPAVPISASSQVRRPSGVCTGEHTPTHVWMHTCVCTQTTPYMCTCKHTIRVLQAQRRRHSQTHTHIPPAPVPACTHVHAQEHQPSPHVLSVSGKPQAMGSLSHADRSILLCLPVLQSTVLRPGWYVMGLVMFEASKYKWRCLWINATHGASATAGDTRDVCWEEICQPPLPAAQ